MKSNKLALVLAVFCLLLVSGNVVYSQNRVVDNPPFSVYSHPSVIIDKIELKDTATDLYMTIYQKQGQWIQISSDTYIRAAGQKYVIKSATGIELNTETYPDASGQIVFTLHFPAIDPSTRQIDFLESDCSNCFKIWGIELTPGISAKRAEVPDKVKAETLVKEDGKSLAIPELKSGVATFKGRILGYVPEMMNWNINLYVDNPVTGIQEELETQLNNDGSFELKVPLVTTMQVMFRTLFYNDYILLSPDKETTFYMDLYQKCRQETANKTLKCPPAKYIYFGGANAEINNQIEDKNIRDIRKGLYSYAQDFNAILNMSPEQYKLRVLSKMNQEIENLSQKNLTKKAYEFVALDIQFCAMQRLMFADSDLKEAYRRAHKLDYGDKMPGYTEPVFDQAYYSFLKEIPFNQQLSLYSNYFGNVVNSSKYLDRRKTRITYPPKELYQELINSGTLTPEEKEYVEYALENSPDNMDVEKQQKFKIKVAGEMQKLIETGKLTEKNLEPINRLLVLCADSTTDIDSVMIGRTNAIHSVAELFSQEELIGFFEDKEAPKFDKEALNSFNIKISEVLQPFMEKKRIEQAKSYLADILGTSKGIVFDMMTAQFYCKKFEKTTSLTTYELKEISQLENPFYFNYINQKNNELLAKIEANKNKAGYNIHAVPETEDDKLFAEILKPFAGKVIVVDFWATWCAPCRSAMKRLEPMKESLKEKEVVFVYLADETSPLATWQNMIPDIPGEHFRLKTDHFNFLKKKFGVTGIPSYLILNKTGEQIYFQVGFEGPEKLGKIIMDAM